MSEDQWDSVLAVNLESIERINDALLERRSRPADRVRVVDQRHRRQPRADQLRDQQGRA